MDHYELMLEQSFGRGDSYSNDTNILADSKRRVNYVHHEGVFAHHNAHSSTALSQNNSGDGDTDEVITVPGGSGKARQQSKQQRRGQVGCRCIGASNVGACLSALSLLTPLAAQRTWADVEFKEVPESVHVKIQRQQQRREDERQRRASGNEGSRGGGGGMGGSNVDEAASSSSSSPVPRSLFTRAQQQQRGVVIPHTLVFHPHKRAEWFCTSKNGNLMRKKEADLVSVLKMFLPSSSSSSFSSTPSSSSSSSSSGYGSKVPVVA
jgi:hypothetical protein